MLKIPIIGDKNCRLLRVCASVKNYSRISLPKSITLGDWVHSTTRVAGNQMWVIAKFGGEPEGSQLGNGQHVHVDIAPHDYFQKDTLPGDKIPIKTFRDTMSELSEATAEIHIEGHFSLGRDELPGLIKATMFDLKLNGVHLKSRSMSFAVKGSPVYQFSWIDRDDSVVAIIEARAHLTLDSSYLNNAFAIIGDGYDTFLAGPNPGQA